MARKSHIPNHLRKFRKICGLTQTEAAFRLGHKNSNRLSRWEKGVAVPSINNLIKLRILYKTLIDQLYPDLVAELKLEVIKTEEEWNAKRNRDTNRGP